MAVTSKKFGTTQEGEKITLYTIKNSKGMEADVIDFGAILTALRVPDRNGKIDDVVLGFDNAEDYFVNPSYFGSTIGRNANRIANASCEIGGRVCRLNQNEGTNNLHSGPDGYHKRMFKAEILPEGDGVRFSLHSPDGDQGFCGSLDFSVTYRVTDYNGLELEYEGVSDSDTIINPTNHTYFNLSGHSSGSKAAMDQQLMLCAQQYTPVKPGGIPTGILESVRDTPMDFTRSERIGRRIDDEFEQLGLTGGYDHNFVLEVRGDRPERAAVLANVEKTRTMTVYTDCPGIQFYAGNFIVDQTGKGGAVYYKRCAVCLETQYFPNAINEAGFKSPVLRGGERFNSITEYVFS